MIRYTRKQKEIFSSAYMELANLGFAVLVFSQFAGERPPDMTVMIGGFIVYILIHVVSYITSKEQT